LLFRFYGGTASRSAKRVLAIVILSVRLSVRPVVCHVLVPNQAQVR